MNFCHRLDVDAVCDLYQCSCIYVLRRWHSHTDSRPCLWPQSTFVLNNWRTYRSVMQSCASVNFAEGVACRSLSFWWVSLLMLLGYIYDHVARSLHAMSYRRSRNIRWVKKPQKQKKNSGYMTNCWLIKTVLHRVTSWHLTRIWKSACLEVKLKHNFNFFGAPLWIIKIIYHKFWILTLGFPMREAVKGFTLNSQSNLLPHDLSSLTGRKQYLLIKFVSFQLKPKLHSY